MKKLFASLFILLLCSQPSLAGNIHGGGESSYAENIESGCDGGISAPHSAETDGGGESS